MVSGIENVSFKFGKSSMAFCWGHAPHTAWGALLSCHKKNNGEFTLACKGNTLAALIVWFHPNLAGTDKLGR